MTPSRVLTVAATAAFAVASLVLERADAQMAPPAPHIRVGIVGGTNTSTFGGRDPGNLAPSTRRGSLGGVFAVIPVRGHFAIQPEITGATRGAMFFNRVAFAGISGTFIDAFRMDYVEVPVLARFDLLTSGTLRPFLVAGPDVAWKTRCRLTVTTADLSPGAVSSGEGTYGCESLKTVNGQSEEFRPVDVAATGGGGVSFDVFGFVCTAGARYTYSFTTIDKVSERKHRVFSGLATVEFPLRR